MVSVVLERSHCNYKLILFYILIHFLLTNILEPCEYKGQGSQSLNRKTAESWWCLGQKQKVASQLYINSLAALLVNEDDSPLCED